MTAIAALTERIVLSALRDDLPFAILAPVGNYVLFNFALRNVIHTPGMTFSQYVLPVIVVQVIFIGGLTTIDRAAKDELSDFGERLRTLPIPATAPLIARMLYCLVRGTLSLLAACAVAYVFGFRMLGGFVYAAAFGFVVLTLVLALSLAADTAGILYAARQGAKSRTGGFSQLLLVPQMLLILLSTGMAPADSFPDWLHPFVRNQPVSQVTETLRGFASGHVVVSNLFISAAWCVGLLAAFAAIAMRIQRQTR